jgi:succinate dehydrogenase / fumarate reductase membrane anchor subunit
MKESTFWSWHIIAAIAMIVVLTIHMGVMHLDNLMILLGFGQEDVLSFQSVLERSKSIYYLFIYLILLGAALYHGLYGFQTILFETSIGKKLAKPIKVLIPIGGFLLFIWGAYAIIVGYTSIGG